MGGGGASQCYIYLDPFILGLKTQATSMSYSICKLYGSELKINDIAFWVCALKALPTGCVCALKALPTGCVCSEGLAYWVCALKALPTGGVCALKALSTGCVCSEGLVYWVCVL